MKGEKTDYCVENVDYLGAAWWQEEKRNSRRAVVHLTGARICREGKTRDV